VPADGAAGTTHNVLLQHFDGGGGLLRQAILQLRERRRRPYDRRWTYQAGRQRFSSPLARGWRTAVGKWLRYARELFEKREDTLRHAILLTDGRNGQFPGRLAAAIELCTGVFSCDCRGVDTDWDVDELRKISTALLGTVDIVPDPAGLAADFEAIMKASIAKEVADVALRVWTPQRAAVRFVKQVAPAVEDLTPRHVQAAPQAATTRPARGGPRAATTTYAWTSSRERSARRCSPPGSAWSSTRDPARRSWARACPGDLDRRRGDVHPDQQAYRPYTGQAELAEAIQDGLEARKAGDDDTAAAKLGRAVALAHESGNEDTANLLAKVVDVIDPATGTGRLKANVGDADEMALDTRSSKTVRIKK
jgi:hypothetical protein